MESISKVCATAKQSRFFIAGCSVRERIQILTIISKSILEGAEAIVKANKEDVLSAEGKSPSFIDRLTLTYERLGSIAQSVLDIAALPDPLNIVLEKWTNADGLDIAKVSVPLGVIGIIYEARPNVTVDAIALCVMSGNSVILRGSKDAIRSNCAIVAAIKAGLRANKMLDGFIQLIEDTSREGAEFFMSLRQYVDVLIPRGSASLINTAVEKSRIPVIETGTGNCHIYVEKTADLETAKKILVNAKMQRQSVCNAAESLVVDREIAVSALPQLLGELRKFGTEIRGCEETVKLFPEAKPACTDDYYSEFLDNIISCKVVSGYKEAIEFINEHSTMHSEAIITKDKAAAEAFKSGIDSAAVYVNASTRFTDGGVFGFGAEMGISTQRLHARGPMGLRELTSYKYVVDGDGQIRK